METQADGVKVAVVFGGRSVEHEISIITGLEVLGALDVRKYHAFPVYIAQDGRWYTGHALADRDFYRRLPEALLQLSKVALLPIPGVGGLTVLDESLTVGQRLSGRRVQKIIPVDIFFPALHGSFGEDGCIQGLFEMASTPYVGSDVLASALSMNKWLSKILLRANGIPVLPGAKVERDPWRQDPVAARDAVLAIEGVDHFPLFVKPCNLGSSIGVSPAANAAELDAALAQTFRFDSVAIVEPQIVAITEINVSVMRGTAIHPSVVETPLSKTGILTYEDKYGAEGKAKKRRERIGSMADAQRRIDPEDMPAPIKTKAQDLAVKAFQILGCSGVARVDFILDQTSSELFLNEINTLPGSMAYYLWEQSTPPLTYTALLTAIIENALQTKISKDSNQRDMGFKALFQ